MARRGGAAVGRTDTPPLARRPLTRGALGAAVAELTARDAGLARIVVAHGPPPLWARPQGFATLARIVLEQQVSLASAATLLARITRALGGDFSADAVARAGVDGLRALGLTRQKAAYLAGLAERVAVGTLPLVRLARLSDDEVYARLVAVPGIGPWSANIYLLMALRRPDVWPPGDLALQRTMVSACGLPRVPSSDEAARIAERWKPWRAVAARILWHGYLAGRSAAATDDGRR